MRVRDIQIGLTIAALLTLVSAAGAQDLGSFNKTFGAPTKHATGTKHAVRKKRLASVRPKAGPRKADDTAAVRSDSTIVGRPTSFFPAAKTRKVLTTAELKQYLNLLDEGSKARYSRNYGAAEAAFKRANTLNPNDARALAGLGAIYSDQQLWREASEAYGFAVALDPKNAVTLVALSYVLSQPIYADDLSERYERAEKAARLAVELAPSNPIAHDQLGTALRVRGHVGPETEAAYRRAIELDPAFAPAYAHLGRLLSLRGRTADADAAFQKAIANALGGAERVLVAEVLQSESRFADAEKLLLAAVAQDPKDQSALVMLGHTRMALGKYADAEDPLVRALAVTPNAYSAAMLLSSLYRRQGRLEEAEVRLFEAQRVAPASEKRMLARQFEALGDAYSKTGQKVNAVRCYRTASALDVGSTVLASKLARVGAN